MVQPVVSATSEVSETFEVIIEEKLHGTEDLWQVWLYQIALLVQSVVVD